MSNTMNYPRAAKAEATRRRVSDSKLNGVLADAKSARRRPSGRAMTIAEAKARLLARGAKP